MKNYKENNRLCSAGDWYEHNTAIRYNGKRMPVGFEGYDILFTDGTTAELKSFAGSGTPSIGGPKLIATERNLHKILAEYMALADYLAIENPDHSEQWIPKAEAVEYLMARVSLTCESTRRSGRRLKLRLNRNPRTAEATAKLIAEGFTL